MKALALLCLASTFLVSEASACRPNTPAILHEFETRAVQLVQTELELTEGQYTLDTAHADLNMKWVHRDSGIDCPDHYDYEVRALLPRETESSSGQVQDCHHVITLSKGVLRGGDSIGPKLCQPVAIPND